MKGRVVKSTGSWYQVESEAGDTFFCKIRGTFRLKDSDATNPVVVGDAVEFEATDSGNGLISEIFKRKNYIIRKSTKLSKQSQILASNIDRAFLIATIVLPKTSTGFIDRYLVTAEAYSIPVTIVFNKADLYTSDDLEYQKALSGMYESIGYSTMLISALDKKDVKTLRESLVYGINLFSGHSGVGKSTLLNEIDPELNVKTTKISKQHETGVHTTTFAEMFWIREGVYVIDTPGIRDFGMYDFSKYEVSHYFPEMRELFNQCRYDNCMHLNEPGCAVKKAVDEDKIAITRYKSYLSIVEGKDLFK